MKSADFFIGKAKEYINSIDGILPNILSPFSQGIRSTPEYIEQSKRISDVILKIKLLFTEFDRGQLFNDKIAAVDKNIMLYFDKTQNLQNTNTHTFIIY